MPLPNKNPFSSGLPTAKDSADLYNNTVALLNFYNNSKGYKLERLIQLPSSLSGAGTTNHNLSTVDFYSRARHYMGEPMRSSPLELYYKPIDKNKYYKREDEIVILNLEAPMGLYDKRIKPTKTYTFHHHPILTPEFNKAEQEVAAAEAEYKYYVDRHLDIPERVFKRVKNSYAASDEAAKKVYPPHFSDAATFFGYDPDLIKPFHMLTPEEKIARKKLEATPQHKKDVKEQYALSGVPMPQSEKSTNGFTSNQKKLLLKQKIEPKKPKIVEDSVFVPSTPVVPKTVEEIVTPYGKMSAESYKKQFGQKAYERDFKVKK